MPNPAPFVLPVCPGCGIIAPREARGCEYCGTRFTDAAPLAAPDRTDGRIWTSVRGKLPCESCGQAFPLPQVAAELACPHCGQPRFLKAGIWQRALGDAHPVADMLPARLALLPESVASDAADRGMTYRRVGISSIGTERPFGLDPGSFKVSPGHPLCPACHRLLEVTVKDDGSAESRCAGCGERATFGPPPVDARREYPALRAVVAHAHRTDLPRAKAAAPDERAVTLACPSCAAALPVEGEGLAVTCRFCGTQALVPTGLLARRQGTHPAANLIWVLLEGHSEERARLEWSIAEPQTPASLPPPEAAMDSGGRDTQADVPSRRVSGAVWVLLAAVLGAAAALVVFLLVR